MNCKPTNRVLATDCRYGHIACLAQQTRATALPWPSAIDNDYRIWNAYGVSTWPTQLVFDKGGRLRHAIVGDGHDDEVDSTIRRLVAQRGDGCILRLD